MRYVKSPLGLFALVLIAVIVAACGGGEKGAAKTDTSAGTAAPPPPAAEFTLVAKDGTWSADITSGGVVFHKAKGAKKDSVRFEYKTPSVDGAITEFSIIRTAPDTHTFGAKIAMVPCTDNKKQQYTHMAQVWVDQVAYSGCGTKK